MTVVLLHGLGADRTQPLGLFGPLFGTGADASNVSLVMRRSTDVPGASQRVIAPDVRAHGASALIGTPSDFALDALADEVTAAVAAELAATEADSLPPGSSGASTPLTIIGISMGAALALRIALRELLPVRRAIFVRPAFTSEPLPHHLQAFPLIAQLLHDLGPDAGAAAFRGTAAYRSVLEQSPLGGAGLLTQFTAPDAVARVVRLVEIPRNRAYASAAELGTLADHGVQSLVVGTPRDAVHPLSVAEEWAAGLGSPLELVPARDDGQRAQSDAIRAAAGAWLAASH